MFVIAGTANAIGFIKLFLCLGFFVIYCLCMMSCVCCCLDDVMANKLNGSESG